MRTKVVVGALLLLIFTGAALSTSQNILTEPPTQRPPLMTSSSSHESVEALPGPGRKQLAPTEAVLASGDKLLPPETKSLLIVPARLKHGDYVWNETGVPPGKVTIWVDLRRQMISAFRSGHEIGTAVIIYGAEDMSSPEGTFPILRKVSDYHSRSYDAPMPNSLFITNDGVALHGSPMSRRRASHGCIGLPVEFSNKLFEASKVGDIVEITRSDDTPINQRGSLDTVNMR